MSELEERATRLSELLVQRGLISEAQIELAMADREINDLPLEEVLLARGWIREDVLYDAAPWLKTKGKPPAASKQESDHGTSSGGSKSDQKAADKPAVKQTAKAASGPAQESESPVAGNYEDNLKAYRDLLKKITGHAED